MTMRERFRAAREAARLTQPEVAAIMGVSTQTIYRLESGKTKRVDEVWIEKAIEAMGQAA